jgi:cephalosporin hydroxylase
VLFDVFLEGGITGPAGALLPVRLHCPFCRQPSGTSLWNRRWNQLACSHCRWTARQFTNACPATVVPRTRQIGHVGVRQHQVDWRQYGPTSMCLGPDAERRVMLCFQFIPRGLPRRPIAFTATAHRTDSGHEVAAWHDTWLPCSCSGGACKHNRLVRWLPPTGIWEQTHLDCNVRLLTEHGDLVYEDRLRLDIAPPTWDADAQRPIGDEESPPISSDRGESPETSAELSVVDRFHHLYYYGLPGEHQVWVRTFWMNVPCIQCPLDLWVYQEIISEQRPDVIIETGTLLGGTTLFLADTLNSIGNGKIISIDVQDLPRPAHPRIEYVSGSSTDADLIRRLVAGRPADETRLVILDSDHSKSHVLAEMKAFAPLIGVGGYMIVTDSNTNGHPVFPDYGPGPYEAVEQFLRECDEFQIDPVREKHKLTFNPRGYLKRVKPARPPAEAVK